jgi:hypothetical protein
MVIFHAAFLLCHELAFVTYREILLPKFYFRDNAIPTVIHFRAAITYKTELNHVTQMIQSANNSSEHLASAKTITTSVN